MKSPELILTTDYEIFGNGSGDVLNCMIKPSEKMMNLAENYHHQITFYVEVCELWAFENEIEYKDSTGQNAFESIRNQLVDILKRGHDIQLHLHPQWIDYQYNSDNNTWELNYDLWRLPSVREHDFGEYGKGVFGIINKGKSWLENLLQGKFPDYKCDTFRAGAWCIQPENEVIKALKELGFRNESTVAPGMKYDGTLTRFDFSKFKKHPSSWKIGANLIEMDDKSELIELPITTAKTGIFHQLYFTLLKRFRQNASKAENCQSDTRNSEKDNWSEKFRRYILPAYRMLDFAAGSTFEEMRYITKKYLKKHGENSKIVMISHPKNFGDSAEFEKYLQWFNNKYKNG